MVPKGTLRKGAVCPPDRHLYGMQNPDLARCFDEVADLLEIDDENPFRVRAYRNAAHTIRDFPDAIADWVRQSRDLTEIPGIGNDLAEKLSELVTTGELSLRTRLSRGAPPAARPAALPGSAQNGQAVVRGVEINPPPASRSARREVQNQGLWPQD